MTCSDVNLHDWPAIEGNIAADLFTLSLVVALSYRIEPSTFVPLIGARFITLVEAPLEAPVNRTLHLIPGKQRVDFVHLGLNVVRVSSPRVLDRSSFELQTPLACRRLPENHWIGRK